MNSKGKYQADKKAFLKFMKGRRVVYKQYRSSGEPRNISLSAKGAMQYIKDAKGDTKVAVFEDDCGKRIYFDMNRGLYLEPEAGMKPKGKQKRKPMPKCLREFESVKRNRRRYKGINIKNDNDTDSKQLLIPDYWLMIALTRREYRQDYENFQRKGFVINHKSGNTYDCSRYNLEITPNWLNNAHSRLMSELAHAFPGAVIETVCEAGSNIYHHFFKQGIRVSGEQIIAYNQAFPECRLQAYKDKKGDFQPKYSRAELYQMAEFFGIADYLPDDWDYAETA